MDLDTCSNTYSTIVVHAHQCVARGPAGMTRSIYFYSPLSNKEKINYLSRITKIHSRVVRGKPHRIHHTHIIIIIIIQAFPRDYFRISIFSASSSLRVDAEFTHLLDI